MSIVGRDVGALDPRGGPTAERSCCDACESEAEASHGSDVRAAPSGPQEVAA